MRDRIVTSPVYVSVLDRTTITILNTSKLHQIVFCFVLFRVHAATTVHVATEWVALQLRGLFTVVPIYRTP